MESKDQQELAQAQGDAVAMPASPDGTPAGAPVVAGRPVVRLPGLDLRYGSNAVRLTLRQWIVVGLVVVLAMSLVPPLWERLEPLEDAPDYRVPFELSNDYWLYQRWCRRSAGRGDVLVLGDSVVWGLYVLREETLSHCLTAAAGGRRRFANLGVNGTYPAALDGLIDYYGGDIAGRDVVLHFNLLWLSSPQHDLQEERAGEFNHPALVPQFWPNIPAYDESLSRRVSHVLDRNVPFFAWANHMRTSRLGRGDLPTWSLEHPYDNPAQAVRLEAPAKADERHEPPVPWDHPSRRIGKQAPAWVPPAWVLLERSIQWRLFQSVVRTLRERGNRVVVVVGPFNEHLLEKNNLAVYRRLRDQAVAHLRGQGVACCVPPTLPSELYGDSNHPLAAGYARLAEWLVEQEEFATTVMGSR